MYKALDVANYIICYCHENRYPINNLKLQQILYFIQAEFLVVTNSPCFVENIKACNLGVIVPNVYHSYKVYGTSNILPYSKMSTVCFSKDDLVLVNGVVDEISNYSTAQLIEIISNQYPWLLCYDRYIKRVIPNEIIKEFFKEV